MVLAGVSSMLVCSVSPGPVEAELPDEALEAVAGRRVEANLLAHAFFRLGQPERKLVVHLREIRQRPLHLHAIRQ